MFRSIFFMFMSLTLAKPILCQFNADNFIIKDVDNFSGTSIGIGDLNGDLLDDLLFIDKAFTIKVAYQNVNDQPFEFVSLYTAPEQIWSMAIADINSDGRNDIFVCYFKGATILFNGTDGFQSFEFALEGVLLPQTCNFIDVDNDGGLELFVSHDNGPNKVISIKDGEAVYLDLMDDTDGGIYDGSGNYASLWTDFDLDGDIDLYISKCSGFAGSSEDPRRVNRLYVNDSSGFTNRASEIGIAFGEQSWASDFGDIDNDGDLDLFVANHGADNLLYLNEDGNYVDRSDWLDQENNGNPYQCFFMDVNNDTYLDIVVAGSLSYMFINNAGNSFRKIDNYTNTRNALSCTYGEFNGDGYLDLLATFSADFILPGNVKDLVLINDGGDNNHLFVNLFGVTSNISGIGARLELYGPWGVQLREVRSGVSYGVSSSLSVHFGLGNTERADSLVIYWPSGKVDRIMQVQANERYLVYEGECSVVFQPVELEGENSVLCSEDTLAFSSESELVWGDGVSTSQRNISSPGTYTAISNNEHCQKTYVQAFRIMNFIEDLSIQAKPGSTACDGEIIQLQAPAGSNYTWNNGDEENISEVDETFTYTVSFDNQCGEMNLASIDVEFLDAPQPVAIDDTIDVPGIANPSAIGDSIIWYADSSLAEELGRGNSLAIEVKGDTSVYATNLAIQTLEQIIVPVFNAMDANTGYAPNHVNGRQYFKVNETIVVHSVMVTVKESGLRQILIFDDMNNLVYHNNYELNLGSNVIDLGVSLVPGIEYSMTTDETTNMEILGDLGPRMLHLELSEHYPFDSERRITFTKSNFGNVNLFYFYNWNIASEYKCESEPTSVAIEVNLISNTLDVSSDLDWYLYPNPSGNLISIQSSASKSTFGLFIYDFTGRQRIILPTHSDLSAVDLSVLEPGVYRICIYSADRISTPKLFVKSN